MTGRPGKLEITPTKPLNTQRELSLAYSPGVAVPCLEIEKDAATFTLPPRASRGGYLKWDGRSQVGRYRCVGLETGHEEGPSCSALRRSRRMDLEVNTKDVDAFVNWRTIRSQVSAASISRTSRRGNAS